MDSPNTKISRGDRSLFVVRKFITEQSIYISKCDVKTGFSLAEQESSIQNRNLIYKKRNTFSQRDSWVTNRILKLQSSL